MLKQFFARLAVVAASISTALGVALFAPLAAHAEPVRIQCKWNDAANDYTCAQMCTQKLPDGSTVYYPDGTEITITTADGKTTSFKCSNGTWTQTARFIPTDILGTINLVGSIAGLKGDITETVNGCAYGAIECTPDSVFTSSYTIGHVRSLDPGCNPQQVTCFP